MTSPLLSSMRQTYWRLAHKLHVGAKSAYPADFSSDEIALIQRLQGRTLTTPERIVALTRAIDYVVGSGIAGDVVECGVWKGGSMMAAALTLLRHGDTRRRLYLYDTFDGMPPPTDADKDYMGSSAESQMARMDMDSIIWARAQIDEVRANMQSTAYPEAQVRYVRGKVEDTIPGEIPEAISVLRLDTDWYASTRHEMEHLFPRLVPGGVLILDDYGHWEGAKRAVDEYVAAHRVRLLLCRIDMGGRIAIKQA